MTSRRRAPHPLLLAVLLLAGCSKSPDSAEAGKAQAEKDLAAGLLQLREAPTPAPAWYGPYHDKLQKIGVGVVVVDHPGRTNFTEADNAYNAVMTAEIEKKHGAGIVGRLLKESYQEHEARVRQQTDSPAAGQTDADKDIAAGRLQLREAPTPPPAWLAVYHSKLQEIGVAVVPAAPRGVPSLSAADKTYNAAMTAAIEKKHGAGILDRLRDEARKEQEEPTKAR